MLKIVFEGPNGVGKTPIITNIVKELSDKYHIVAVSDPDYGAEFYDTWDKLRRTTSPELELAVWNIMHQQVQKKITEAYLEDADAILIDRWWPSSMVFNHEGYSILQYVKTYSPIDKLYILNADKTIIERNLLRKGEPADKGQIEREVADYAQMPHILKAHRLVNDIETVDIGMSVGYFSKYFPDKIEHLIRKERSHANSV